MLFSQAAEEVSDFFSEFAKLAYVSLSIRLCEFQILLGVFANSRRRILRFGRNKWLLATANS